ncbi:MAG: alpha/beta fold hydrolase [Actinoplanes sp.]
MTLSHDSTGSGRAVLLLHSTASDRRMWDPQVASLAGAGFRAVRCDLPGFGESPVPDRPYDTAAAVLDTVGDDRFAVVAAPQLRAFEVQLAGMWSWTGRVTCRAWRTRRRWIR